MYVTKKSIHNPILIPNKNHYWEGFASFNMCPIKKDGSIYGLYRAISVVDKLNPQQQISIIGIGKSSDGIHFEDRKPFIEPEAEWDIHGCEDPRVTFFEGKYYIFYTALSRYPFVPEGIKVGVAVSDDLEKVDERHLVTPFNAKAMTLFPERINGKITVIFSIHTDTPPAQICFAQFDNIEDLWNEEYWNEWIKDLESYTISFNRDKYDHLEIGAQPVKTKDGWLLIYSHIQNYFEHPDKLDRIFGIEALLLDLNDLTKIIGRTKGPILVPGESYELSGYIGNVIFPTGALVKDSILTIYYGAADTTTCIANLNLNDLITTMIPERAEKVKFKRLKENPIIVPRKDKKWEAKGTFNPAAILIEGKTHILYRAFSEDNTSTLGYALSSDGVNIDLRFNEPVYIPREDFEIKKNANDFSGCEDPRLTQIGENIYLCYTAYNSLGPPRVAISVIKEKDFVNHKWDWSKPILITPEGLDDKDTCIFPEKFEDGYFILHRVENQVCGDYIDSLDFKNNMVDKCISSFGARINAWDSSKVGITAPPIKTEHGWLLLYHGVSKSHNTYRVGAVLLDLEDPTIVLSRITDPVFEPETEYEKVGFINNVVFPCGMTVKDEDLYIYYGGADRVVGVAKMKLSNIVDILVRGKELNKM